MEEGTNILDSVHTRRMLQCSNVARAGGVCSRRRRVGGRRALMGLDKVKGGVENCVADSMSRIDIPCLTMLDPFCSKQLEVI